MTNKMSLAIGIGAAAFLLLPDRALADKDIGFAYSDLTQVPIRTPVLPGKRFAPKAEAGRLTLGCLECADLEAVDILLGDSDDGTEGRLRSGETQIATIEANCRRSDPDCRIDAIEIAGAIGWVSRTSAVGLNISTTVLFKDGDRLIIRSIANDIETAVANGNAACETYGREIIGNR
jgi:hypothetical protein